MFDECGLELWPEMTTRGRFCPCQQPILILFFAYFICVIALPALWAIVTEAIYDERESNNFVRTYAPYFTKAERTHVPKDGFVRGYGNANIMGQTAGSTR